MPLFMSDKRYTIHSKVYIKMMASSYEELERYYKRYHGSLAYAPKGTKEAVQKEEDRLKLAALEGKKTFVRSNMFVNEALCLKWSCPPAERGLTKTKVPIQILMDSKDKWIAESQKICVIPEDYMPVLGMMMRKDFSMQCGGWDDQVEKYFEQEIRGKLSQLIRRPKGLGVIRNPVHEDLQFLNVRLENFDLGRCSGLNLYDNASEDPLRVGSRVVETGESTGVSFADYMRLREE